MKAFTDLMFKRNPKVFQNIDFNITTMYPPLDRNFPKEDYLDYDIINVDYRVMIRDVNVQCYILDCNFEFVFVV